VDERAAHEAVTESINTKSEKNLVGVSKSAFRFSHQFGVLFGTLETPHIAGRIHVFYPVPHGRACPVSVV